MLVFNVKKRYYDLMISGKKDTEYREAKDYWHSRLSNIKIGDTVVCNIALGIFRWEF